MVRLPAVLLLLSACGLPPTLSSIQDAVFTPSCATNGCHDSKTAIGALDLEKGKSFGQLVNQPAQNVGAQDDQLLRVKPGDPDHSFLVLKIEPHLPVSDGVPMPNGKKPLSQEEIDAIAQWVRDGAKND